MAAVARPFVIGDPRAGGQAGDAPLGAARDGFQRECRISEPATRAVGRGVDAQAGEAQLGFGELGDGGCVRPLEQQEQLAVGAEDDGGRGRRIDERGEGGRRRAVRRGVLRTKRRREDEGEQREAEWGGVGHGGTLGGVAEVGNFGG